MVAVPAAAGVIDPVDTQIPAAMSESYPGLTVRIGQVGGAGDDLGAVLSDIAASRQGSTPPGIPPAVVAPLITGPHPEFSALLRSTVNACGVPAAVTDALGPHPQLAQALHERLAEAGLARRDRVRMVGLVTAADGVIVATVGGAEAVRAADMTSVLLASRLAVPVVPASLDGTLPLDTVADRMRASGASRIALAPCLIGPEADLDRMAEQAERARLEPAAPMGVHPAIGRLLALRYEMALDELGVGYVEETG